MGFIQRDKDTGQLKTDIRERKRKKRGTERVKDKQKEKAAKMIKERQDGKRADRMADCLLRGIIILNEI